MNFDQIIMATGFSGWKNRNKLLKKNPQLEFADWVKHVSETTAFPQTHQLVLWFFLDGTFKEPHGTWNVPGLHPLQPL